MNRWQRKNHERALDEMTAKILQRRREQPTARTHGAAVRTTLATHQLTVPDIVPASEVRANLEAQLAVINAREGS
jgi:hypothetical protein